MSLDPNKLIVSTVVDIKPKIEINKGGLDYYTKGEIKEILKYKIKPVKKYLYEADYDDVDYDFAKDYFDLGKADILLGVCSAVRKGNLLGRKFD